MTLKVDREPCDAVTDGSGKTRGLVAQILNYIPGKIFPALLALTTTFVFTRVFAADAYGRYSVTLSIVIFVVAGSSQWLQQAINRFLAVETATDTRRFKDAIVFGCGIISLTIVFVGITVVVILPDIVDNEWHRFIVPATLATLGLALFKPMAVVFQAQWEAHIYSRFVIIQAVLKFVIAIVWVFAISRTADGLLWAVAISALTVTPSMAVMARMDLKALVSRERVRQARKDIRRFAAYGLPMTGWFITATLLNLSDRYVIQWVQGAGDVGIYAANYDMVGGAVQLLIAPIMMAGHPYLMRAWESRRRNEVSQRLNSITSTFLLGGVVLVAFISLYSVELATLLIGQDFREGHQVMPLVAAGLVVWQLGMFVHKPLEFQYRTRTMLAISSIVVIVNIVANMIAVPRVGYMGAAWTTVGSYALYCVAVGYAGRGVIDWRIGTWFKWFAGLFYLSSIYAIVIARPFIARSMGEFALQVVCIAAFVGLTCVLLLLTTDKNARELAWKRIWQR